ncbi:MAG: EndoU domain-containing protein [Cytophagaceae bacterium]
MKRLFLSWLFLASSLLIFTCQKGKDTLIPAKTERHIFEGEINGRGKAVGCHHISAINSGHSRIVSIISKPDRHHVYEATVEIFDKKRSEWIRKEGRSSFYPDAWSKEKVLSEITSAFNNPAKVSKGTKWESVSDSGIKISGYTNEQGQITTAYPLYVH